MSKSQATEIVGRIRKFIDEDNLKAAITLLHDNFSNLGNWQLLDRLSRLDDAYKNMIRFFVEGNNDPSREKFYANTKEELNTMCNMLDSMLRSKDDDSLYFSILRTHNYSHDNLSEIINEYRDIDANIQMIIDAGQPIPYDILKKSDNLIKRIFESIWTNLSLSADEYKLLREILQEDNSKNTLLASIIASSLFLSLMQYYDKAKLKLLSETVVTAKSSKIVARCWVGLILILYKYRHIISKERELPALIQAITEREDFSKLLHETIFNIIRTRDTDKMNKKFKEEIIPDMMRMKPNLEQKMKSLEIDLENINPEENPEWQELMDKSGLTDKLKELTEMQMAGGDVMMLAFSNMKNFPFFNHISNWFVPFSPQNSEFYELRKHGIDQNILDFLSSTSMFCESDKYSFIFALEKMPGDSAKLFKNQFEAQFSQMEEDKNTSLNSALTTDLVTEIGAYIKDVYRFYRLFARRHEFANPFESPINFLELPVISEQLQGEEVLRLLSEFYFTRSYFDDALPYFKKLEKTGDAVVLQKIGYIYDSAGDYKRALDYYVKAELFDEASTWLIKRMAVCYKNIGNYDASTEYYKKLLENSPENYALILQTGHVLLASGKVEEALKYYYKAEYLKEGSDKALRPIAWCEFLIGNYDKSIATFNKIPEENRKFADFLNCGHAYLAQDKIKGAIKMYKKANSLGNLRSSLYQDIDHLKKAGVDESVIHLIPDSISYDF